MADLLDDCVIFIFQPDVSNNMQSLPELNVRLKIWIRTIEIPCMIVAQIFADVVY